MDRPAKGQSHFQVRHLELNDAHVATHCIGALYETGVGRVEHYSRRCCPTAPLTFNVDSSNFGILESRIGIASIYLTCAKAQQLFTLEIKTIRIRDSETVRGSHDRVTSGVRIRSVRNWKVPPETHHS